MRHARASRDLAPLMEFEDDGIVDPTEVPAVLHLETGTDEEAC